MDKQTLSTPREPKEPSKKPEITFIPPEDKKQSRLGITSFVLAVITLLGYIIMASLGTAMIEPYVTPDGLKQPTQDSLEAMTSLAAVFLVIVVINLVGLILGLVGSLSKKQKRSYSVIGAIINGVVLLTILILFVFVLNG